MKKPVVLVVMDGVGETPEELGNMVKKATTPTLNELKETCPWQIIKAHGTAVGLPSDDDMGNSEVGHNALGCGQIYSQGAKLVNESIESGKIYTSDAWKNLVSDLKDNGATLHFIGLLSDGNVHSNISHLIAMLKEAKKEGVKRVRCHILLDGRDVPATSALEYVQELEDVLASLNDADFDGKIASGGGRMTITMDRYQANWPMVKAGWDTHVHGIGRQFATAKEAIETYRAETGVIDQDLPAFVIAENGKPVGKMEDGDSVILFNFRGDRAQEISMAFDGDSSFDKFDRGEMPKVKYAGMLQYDGDLCIPKSFLVNPPEIRNTLTELLVANGVNRVCLLRNAEVWPCDVFLERQPLRKVLRGAGNVGGSALRRAFLRRMPVDEGDRNHRPGGGCHQERQVRLHPLQLPQRRHGWPHRQPAGHRNRGGIR